MITNISEVRSVKDMTVKIPDELYTKLNRASREYDGLISDAYYFISGGNHPTDNTFTSLVDEALKAYYAYSDLKDKVSNEYVMPTIREAYDLDKDIPISNNWNINFDGDTTCHIANIKIGGVSERVLHQEVTNPDWIVTVAHLNSRLNVIDEIIGRLSTITLQEPAITCRNELRDIRTDLRIRYDENKSKFMKRAVAQWIEGHDASKCTWKLTPSDGVLTITTTE